MNPVLVSKFRPVGRAGEIPHEVTAPPVLLGLADGDITVSMVKSKVDGE